VPYFSKKLLGNCSPEEKGKGRGTQKIRGEKSPINGKSTENQRCKVDGREKKRTCGRVLNVKADVV